MWRSQWRCNRRHFRHGKLQITNVAQSIIDPNLIMDRIFVNDKKGCLPYYASSSSRLLLLGWLARPLYLFCTYYRGWTYYQILGGFHRTIATGAASQQRTLTPPGTWSCPNLAVCSNVETILFWTCATVTVHQFFCILHCHSSGLWISNIPLYFYCAETPRTNKGTISDADVLQTSLYE